MTLIRLAMLCAIAPALCALSTDDHEGCVASAEHAMSCSEDAGPARDERALLCQYVDSLDWQIDAQIEEIAANIPTERIEALRNEHYAWRLQRDLQCNEAGRKSTDELAELRCLSERSGHYFDLREAELSLLEAARAQKPDTEKAQRGARVLPAIP